jgi:hypothetical protein
MLGDSLSRRRNVSRIAAIHSTGSLAPNEAHDYIAGGPLLGNPVAITAWPFTLWIAGYNVGLLAVENVRFEGATSYGLSLNIIHFTVRNVGNTNVGSYWVYVNEVQ